MPRSIWENGGRKIKAEGTLAEPIMIDVGSRGAIKLWRQYNYIKSRRENNDF